MAPARINTTSISVFGGGTIELPPDVLIGCPACGGMPDDKDSLRIALIPVQSPDSKTGYLMDFAVTCKRCGYAGTKVAVYS